MRRRSETDDDSHLGDFIEFRPRSRERCSDVCVLAKSPKDGWTRSHARSQVLRMRFRHSKMNTYHTLEEVGAVRCPTREAHPAIEAKAL